MADWLTIEVVDALFPAAQWRSSHESELIEAALTHGVPTWEWHETRWGVVLELLFPDDEQLERYRQLPGVVAALDAVPDRSAGLAVYRGRGGGSGARVPRRPVPVPLADAAPWPHRADGQYLDLVGHGSYERADGPQLVGC
jgi:hypothetical protein